ncbi:MAG: hypothetical protein ACYCZ7_01885 [Minisyncoccota bacterium]
MPKKNTLPLRRQWPRPMLARSGVADPGKVPSGSECFRDMKQGLIVVIEREYEDLFLVHFMSGGQRASHDPSSRFTRKELEEMLSQAQNGVVEFSIAETTGHVKAGHLRKFLSERFLRP